MSVKAQPKSQPKAKPKAKGSKWIQGADLKEGAFTKQADKAGKSVAEFAKDKADAPGVTGKRARLALVFQKMARKKKGGK